MAGKVTEIDRMIVSVGIPPMHLSIYQDNEIVIFFKTLGIKMFANRSKTFLFPRKLIYQYKTVIQISI